MLDVKKVYNDPALVNIWGTRTLSNGKTHRYVTINKENQRKQAVRSAINRFIRASIPGKSTPKRTKITTPNLEIKLPGDANYDMAIWCNNDGKTTNRSCWSVSFSSIETVDIQGELIVFNGIVAFKY